MKNTSEKYPLALDIKRDLYAMASTNGFDAEITMYGTVVKTRPKSLWTGEEVEGDFIILDEFMADLDKLKNCRTIPLVYQTCQGKAKAQTILHYLKSRSIITPP